MFTERFNQILDKIGASPATLSSYAGFDRTNISRIKSGTRIPKISSPTANKLSRAIYLFSKEHRTYKKLCKAVGIPARLSEADAEIMILKWLYEGDEIVSPSEAGSLKASRKQKREAFGDRFSVLMELADISNKRLSQLVHADPSLISRYKKGIRTPISNPELSLQISEILFERITSSGKLHELSELMKCPEGEIDEEALGAWLYDTDGRETDEAIAAAETFLDIFDSFRPGNTSMLPAPEDILSDIPSSDDYVYIGTKGLRSAVLRFLAAAVSEHARELYLYSDENQDWMTGDPSFLLKWASLMSALVKNGTKIIIIHNLDRSLSEMNDAIKSWLPLYMSGMIESYFCRKLRNNRFSHTIFLNPESGCIKAFHAMGSLEKKIYHYYTEKRLLEICMDEYRFLLKNSSPLIRAVSPHLLPEVSNVTIVQDSLSLSTMSRELVESFNSPALAKQWEKYSASFLGKLESNYIHECIPIADSEALSNGRVPIWQPQGVEKLFYTPEQYEMHLRDIKALSERYENYRFYPLPESPFPNIELIVSDTLTKITPASRPGFSFAFTHAPMCRAFMDYVNTLINGI
ncbi:MAG: hypothetical protein IJ695_02815 [Butyrivibrio sp.]|nr:hypothetical protein [Butyrivibrio sp.]